MTSNLRIATINDEISAHLTEVIEFIQSNDIRYVELRTIQGKNLIDYSPEELRGFHSLLQSNHIGVSAIASPLFKWYPEGAGREYSQEVDSFYFNPFLNLENKKRYIKKAIAAARILETQYVRIFSSLLTSAVQYSFEQDPLLDLALNEAQKHGIILLLENEPPCFVHSMKDIKYIAKKFFSKNLRVWFDVANFHIIHEKVLTDDLKELKNYVKYFHLKDFDEHGKYVPVGKGVINYREIISDIRKKFSHQEIYLSLEPHVSSDPKGAVIESYKTLKQLLSGAA